MAGTLESRARYSPSFVRPVCGLRLTRARFSFATNSAFSIDPTGSFPRQIIFAYMDNLHIYEYIYTCTHISKTIRFDRNQLHSLFCVRKERVQSPIIPIEKLAEAKRRRIGLAVGEGTR